MDQHVPCVPNSGRISPISVARFVEISSTSPKSFEDAIKEQEADVENGKVMAYKVNLKVTFVLDGSAA